MERGVRMSYNPNVPDFDNIAYDDLQKMKENFQILANIATSREDILSLAVEAGDILDSRIVEHNLNILSPSNGYYVRWENGLQVCYHRMNIGTPSGVQSFSWTYPAAFASSNHAYPMGIVAVSGSAATVFGRYVKSSVMRTLEASATQTTFFVEFSSAPSTYIQIFAFAIGRWK